MVAQGARDNLILLSAGPKFLDTRRFPNLPRRHISLSHVRRWRYFSSMNGDVMVSPRTKDWKMPAMHFNDVHSSHLSISDVVVDIAPRRELNN